MRHFDIAWLEIAILKKAYNIIKAKINWIWVCLWFFDRCVIS